MALKRTKIWSKYSKDVLNYIERRSNFGLEVSRQIDSLAKKTRTAIVDGNYMPIQSIFMTAVDQGITIFPLRHIFCPLLPPLYLNIMVGT